MEKYKGFIYEWTNSVNGMKYIGSHYGLDSDSYIGSGVAFRKDLKEFGTNSFTRVILEYIDDSDDLIKAEKKWLEKVNAKDNDLYYNRTNGSSTSKKPKELSLVRGLCNSCQARPVAVNYTDPNGRIHYRKQCDSCLRKGKKLKPKRPAWALSGYKKKPHCEKCSFVAKHPDQLQVFHLDGKLNNTNWTNLKTICANCAIEVSKSKLPWKTGPLTPDF